MSKKVLLVDDERGILEILIPRFKAKACEVSTAGDGEAALALALKNKFDLIITDVLMPKMDGFTFYKELKKNSVTKDVPVIVMTARGKMEDTFRMSGVDDFIAKPFDAQVLMGKVERLLSGQAGSPAGVSAAKTKDFQKKAVVFCKDSSASGEITEFLAAASRSAVVIHEAGGISALFDSLKPESVFLQLDAADEQWLEQAVTRMRQSAPSVPIITFSITSELTGASMVGTVDMDNFIERMKDKGVTKHIGPYNRITFAGKIKDLIPS